VDPALMGGATRWPRPDVKEPIVPPVMPGTVTPGTRSDSLELDASSSVQTEPSDIKPSASAPAPAAAAPIANKSAPAVTLPLTSKAAQAGRASTEKGLFGGDIKVTTDASGRKYTVPTPTAFDRNPQPQRYYSGSDVSKGLSDLGGKIKGLFGGNKSAAVPLPPSSPVVPSQAFMENNDMKELRRLSGLAPLNEKAVSKQQQKFMGMVHAMQKGEKVKGASPELKKVAKTMSKKAAKDYASTRHAGLPKKVTESVMLEAGSTLDHIINKFKHETKNFLSGGELDRDLYEALFDYYSDSGEMPYGVAKARTGDPMQWIEQHLENELSMMGYQRQFTESRDALSELARLAGLTEAGGKDRDMDPGMSRNIPNMPAARNMDPGMTRMPRDMQPTKNMDPGMTRSSLPSSDSDNPYAKAKPAVRYAPSKGVDEGLGDDLAYGAGKVAGKVEKGMSDIASSFRHGRRSATEPSLKVDIAGINQPSTPKEPEPPKARSIGSMKKSGTPSTGSTGPMGTKPAATTSDDIDEADELTECGDMDMNNQQDSMNVSTNMSSDGTKSVNISAQGARADSLLQMLKMAGMRPYDDHERMGMTEPEIIMVSSEPHDQMMDEARGGDTNFGHTVTRGSWVVYDGSKVKRFKTRDGAKAYAEKNGGKVASSEFYADNIQKQGVTEAEMPDLSPEMQQAKQQQQIMMSDTPPQDDNLNMLKAWAEYSPQRRQDYYVIAKFGSAGPNRNIFSNSVQKTLDVISNFPDMDEQDLYDQFDLDQTDADRLYAAYENVTDELDQLGLDEERVTQYPNTPKEEYQTVASITRQGNDLNREKQQWNPDRGRDNPMAFDLEESLADMLESIKIHEADPRRPKGDTGQAEIWTAASGTPAPSAMDEPAGRMPKVQPAAKSATELDFDRRAKADKGGPLAAERGGVRGATNPPQDPVYSKGKIQK
jgi:hypothetical protein